jgi:mRNA interferase HigB
MKLVGEAIAARFAATHADSRKPLQRFLAIARSADWKHFAAMREAFVSADKGRRSGRMIFDIGGNKYRLIARVDFEEQLVVIERVLTHEEYDREVF